MVKQAMAPYVRKMRFEAILRALIGACAVGLFVELVFLIVMHIAAVRPGLGLCWAFWLIPFAVSSALLYALRLRPTLARTARRVDALGLEERIGTMVAYQDDASPLCTVQREDALQKLGALSPAQLPFRLSKGALIAAALIALAVLGVSFIPYDLFRPEVVPVEDTEETRLMRELLDDLRSQIESANLTDEERAALLAQLEETEQAMLAGDGTLEDLAQIMEASGEIAQELEEIEMFKSWLYALTAYDSLRPLAEAILAEDIDQVRSALIDLETGLLSLSGQDQLDALMGLYQAVMAALEQGEPTDDEASIAFAFSRFGNAMESAAIYVLNALDATSIIHNGFEQLFNRISLEFSAEDIWSEAEESKNTHYVDRSNGDQQNPNGEEGADGQGDANNMLYSSDPDDMRGAGYGMRTQQHYAETERIYEPTLDAFLSDTYVPGAPGVDGLPQREAAPETIDESFVPYEQVYGIYYARLLDQITGKEIPEEVLKAIETYFYDL